MGSSEGDMVMLEDSDQLRLLAKILLNQEEPLMKNIKSESERVKYLKECNASYNNVVSLLKDGDDLNNKHKNDKIKSAIADDIHQYIKFFMNSAMQWIRNCNLRVKCIADIKTHFDSLVTELEELDATNVSKHRLFAEEVSLYKKCMWEYTNRRRSASARAFCKAASMVWKEEGMKFPDLVERHKTNLEFEGEFQSLEDVQKLQVYNSIIEESKTAKIPKLEMLSTGSGIAVLVVTAGLMVLDIYTADCPLESLARNSLTAVSEFGAFATQMLVEGAVTEAMTLVGLGEALGVFVVALAGIATGFIAGVLFMGASGLLIDKFIEGGGNNAPSMENLNEIRVLSVKTPDGVAIANEISHHFGQSRGGDSNNSYQIKPQQPKQNKQLAPLMPQPTAGPAYQQLPPATLQPAAGPAYQQLPPATLQPAAGPAYQQLPPATLQPVAGPYNRQQYGMTPSLAPPTPHPTSSPTHQPQYLSSELLRPSSRPKQVAQQAYPSFPQSDNGSFMNPVGLDNAFPTITPPNPDDSWLMDTGATFHKTQNAGSHDEEHNYEI